jgi:hypothetical protein
MKLRGKLKPSNGKLSGKKPSNRVDRDSKSFPSKTGEIAEYETLKVFKTFKVWSFGSAVISNL